MWQRIVEWVSGIALFGLFLKYGIPAIVNRIKGVASTKFCRLIRGIVPLIVDIVEVLGKEFDWIGEQKLLEALKRLEEEIGKTLTPTEKEVATALINAAVAEKNARAVAELGSKEFVDFLKAKRAT